MKWPLVSRARFDALVALHSATAKKLDYELLSASRVHSDLGLKISSLEIRTLEAERHIAHLTVKPHMSPVSKPRLPRRILNALRIKMERRVDVHYVSGLPGNPISYDGKSFRINCGGMVGSGRRG